MEIVKEQFRNIVGRMRGHRYRTTARGRPEFECPICGYIGPFMGDAGRSEAKCPSCAGVERHRLLWLTIRELSSRYNFDEKSLLHVGPEKQFKDRFRRRFGGYTSADLEAKGVDHKVDLCDLPFRERSFDVVIAGHVLEHIKEDRTALANIRRVLKPGGFAILQVPFFGPHTVEYPAPNPYEWGHVRAPGEDYFDRYEEVFSRVEKFRSSDFDERYQPFILEDRSIWPENYPLRPTSPGLQHEDIVPVCYV